MSPLVILNRVTNPRSSHIMLAKIFNFTGLLASDGTIRPWGKTMDTIRYYTKYRDTIRYDIRSQNALPYVMVNSPRLMQRSH